MRHAACRTPSDLGYLLKYNLLLLFVVLIVKPYLINNMQAHLKNVISCSTTTTQQQQQQQRRQQTLIVKAEPLTEAVRIRILPLLLFDFYSFHLNAP